MPKVSELQDSSETKRPVSLKFTEARCSQERLQNRLGDIEHREPATVHQLILLRTILREFFQLNMAPSLTRACFSRFSMTCMSLPSSPMPILFSKFINLLLSPSRREVPTMQNVTDEAIVTHCSRYRYMSWQSNLTQKNEKYVLTPSYFFFAHSGEHPFQI